MDSKKARIEDAIVSLKMFDEYLHERADNLAEFYKREIPRAETQEDEVAILYEIGRLKEELSFLRASAFGYLHTVHAKHPDFKYWLRG